MLGNDSGDDIDLGESDDEFSADSDLEFEEEVFNAPIQAVEEQIHLLPAAQQTEESPSLSPPLSQSNIVENLIVDTDVISARVSEIENFQEEQANNNRRSSSLYLTPLQPNVEEVVQIVENRDLHREEAVCESIVFILEVAEEDLQILDLKVELDLKAGVDKWYKKLELRLIMQVTLNAHKVFQHYTGINKTYQKILPDAIVLLLAYTPTPRNL